MRNEKDLSSHSKAGEWLPWGFRHDRLRALNDAAESPNPGLAALRARTKKQAQDWALALVSQGIEPVIQPDADGKWLVLVPAETESRAAAIVRQYRIENRHWHWRKRVFKQRVMFDWAAGDRKSVV